MYRPTKHHCSSHRSSNRSSDPSSDSDAFEERHYLNDMYRATNWLSLKDGIKDMEDDFDVYQEEIFDEIAEKDYSDCLDKTFDDTPFSCTISIKYAEILLLKFL